MNITYLITKETKQMKPNKQKNSTSHHITSHYNTAPTATPEHKNPQNGPVLTSTPIFALF
jgi:hypothetical protein